MTWDGVTSRDRRPFGTIRQAGAILNGISDHRAQHKFVDNSCQRAFILAPQRAGSPVAGLSANSTEHFFQAAETLSLTEARKVLEAQTASEARLRPLL